MKKVIILLSIIFSLISCWEQNIYNKNNIKKIIENKNNEISKKETKGYNNNITYDSIKNVYILAINDINDLNKLDRLFNKKLNRYSIWFNIPFNNSYSLFFRGINNFDYLSLDFNEIEWNNIERLLELLLKRTKKNNGNSSILVLSFMNKKDFSKKEYEFLKKMKVLILEIKWFNIKKENKNLDRKINKLLEESKNLKKIIIEDYKIFRKN